MAQELYSIGIDVGTTTTQVVFSKLLVEKTGGASGIPSVKITKKDVVYKSGIYYTPLLSRDSVDAERLREIVASEYRLSGMTPRDVTTGAVIITGETARKDNAREVAARLAEFSGDFVVCTAGPDYEAVLAGWGAGAGDLSKTVSGTVCNFDIGGGTTNAAVFRNGVVIDAFAADIGGRLIRVGDDGTISYASERLLALTEALHLGSLSPGRRADTGELARLAETLAAMFAELSGKRPLSTLTRHLLIGHPPSPQPIDSIMFSGGVSEYIYGTTLDLREGLAAYGDIGPLLGLSIRRILPEIGVEVLRPAEMIRATVIGAGSFSTSLSGSTVTVSEQILPVKNVPVVKVTYPGDGFLSHRISAQSRLYDGEQVAVAVGFDDDPGYEDIKLIAGEILQGLGGTQNPVIAITDRDCAKALGLLLRNAAGNHRPVVSLDRIDVENGNYIDIGKPTCGVVPVIVKTLIFS